MLYYIKQTRNYFSMNAAAVAAVACGSCSLATVVGAHTLHIHFMYGWFLNYSIYYYFIIALEHVTLKMLLHNSIELNRSECTKCWIHMYLIMMYFNSSISTIYIMKTHIQHAHFEIIWLTEKKFNKYHSKRY